MAIGGLGSSDGRDDGLREAVALASGPQNHGQDGYFASPSDKPRQAAARAARSAGVTSESLTLSATIRENSGVNT